MKFGCIKSTDLTAAEVAERAGVSRMTVARQAQAGKLRGRRVAGSGPEGFVWVFTEAAVKKWLAKRPPTVEQLAPGELRVNEAAELVGETRATILMAAKRGKLNCRRVPSARTRHGFVYVFTKNDLRKWLKSRQAVEQ